MRLRDSVLAAQASHQKSNNTASYNISSQATMPIYSLRAKTYMDSGASISITGHLQNLQNRRPSNLRIHSFSGSDTVKTTAVGNWGPIPNAHHIPDTQNLISTGSMLDGTTAGVYSTKDAAFIITGLDIGPKSASGHRSVRVTEKPTATQIATREGP